MRIVEVDSGIISLGRQGEHMVTQVRFPIRSIVRKYGKGDFTLVVQRNGDYDFYPVDVRQDENYVYWDITGMDTAVPGVGKCELQYLIGRSVVKSIIYQTQVQAAIYGQPIPSPRPPIAPQFIPNKPQSSYYPPQTPPPPQPYGPNPAQPWIDNVVMSGRDARKASHHAKEYKEDAERAAWEAEENGNKAEFFGRNAEEYARAAQSAAESMSFVTFDVTEDGDVVINRAERLGATSFGFNDDGYLEVSF